MWPSRVQMPALLRPTTTPFIPRIWWPRSQQWVCLVRWSWSHLRPHLNTQRLSLQDTRAIPGWQERERIRRIVAIHSNKARQNSNMQKQFPSDTVDFPTFATPLHAVKLRWTCLRAANRSVLESIVHLIHLAILGWKSEKLWVASLPTIMLPFLWIFFMSFKSLRPTCQSSSFFQPSIRQIGPFDFIHLCHLLIQCIEQGFAKRKEHGDPQSWRLAGMRSEKTSHFHPNGQGEKWSCVSSSRSSTMLCVGTSFFLKSQSCKVMQKRETETTLGSSLN